MDMREVDVDEEVFYRSFFTLERASGLYRWPALLT
jgi:hypothetical protein